MKHTEIKSISHHVYEDLFNQCNGIAWIEKALFKAWESFELKGWNYDGATFVREHKNNYIEVAAFIHDWLNQIGFVGKKVDLYFIKIMIVLNYGESIIFERCKWMQYTGINYFWHWCRFKKPANDLPIYLKIQFK
jgi:hypothetical protein